MLLHQREKRREIPLELAAREPAEGLRSEAEGIGEGQADADAPEIEPQGAAARFAQRESGGLGLSSDFGTSSVGVAADGASFFGESAATRPAISLSEGYFAVRKWT